MQAMSCLPYFSTVQRTMECAAGQILGPRESFSKADRKASSHPQDAVLGGRLGGSLV